MAENLFSNNDLEELDTLNINVGNYIARDFNSSHYSFSYIYNSLGGWDTTNTIGADLMTKLKNVLTEQGKFYDDLKCVRTNIDRYVKYMEEVNAGHTGSSFELQDPVYETNYIQQTSYQNGKKIEVREVKRQATRINEVLTEYVEVSSKIRSGLYSMYLIIKPLQTQIAESLFECTEKIGKIVDEAYDAYAMKLAPKMTAYAGSIEQLNNRFNTKMANSLKELNAVMTKFHSV